MMSLAMRRRGVASARATRQVIVASGTRVTPTPLPSRYHYTVRHGTSRLLSATSRRAVDFVSITSSPRQRYAHGHAMRYKIAAYMLRRRHTARTRAEGQIRR